MTRLQAFVPLIIEDHDKRDNQDQADGPADESHKQRSLGAALRPHRSRGVGVLGVDGQWAGAVVSGIAGLAHAAQHGVTEVVVGATVTSVETTFTVEMFGTRVLAQVATEPRWTLALTVHRMARGSIVTVALVVTAWTIPARWTRLVTRVPGPATWTLTLASDVVTRAFVTVTRVAASRPVRSLGTSVHAIEPSHSWRAVALARYRVTTLKCCNKKICQKLL